MSKPLHPPPNHVSMGDNGMEYNMDMYHVSTSPSFARQSFYTDVLVQEMWKTVKSNVLDGLVRQYFGRRKQIFVAHDPIDH